mmetsp:Transcript_15150/g.26426  ORF Transcript_15150/g.26426 Transcript_15150/m.26426 type:complete len:85 (-) Transcript_15150:724-978(-)
MELFGAKKGEGSQNGAANAQAAAAAPVVPSSLAKNPAKPATIKPPSAIAVMPPSEMPPPLELGASFCRYGLCTNETSVTFVPSA